MNPKLLIIYTGGTIGMKQDPETQALKPFNFSQILEEVPELRKFGYILDTYSFDPVIDSSDVREQFWIDLATLIKENYNAYDGFVILHGTDTMAYSASVLSFMLDHLEKPVVFTGSQLPIGMIRTDGKENLISSIEIAASRDSLGHPCVPEVCIYFENELYRGNRTYKYNAENFKAFQSPNCPILAEVGIHIKFNDAVIRKPHEWGWPLEVNTSLDTRVAIVKLFPGITREYLKAVLSTEGIRAVILESFGCGNSPSSEWFISEISQCISKGIIVLNITQCNAGHVDMKTYANGVILSNIGVISGYDMTTESALAKLYCLMGRFSDNEAVKKRLNINLKGEISKNCP